MKDTIKRIKDDIARLKEQADINHEDIAEMSRQTMRQHEALKNILLEKKIISKEEYVLHRRKAYNELCKDRSMRAFCEYCLYYKGIESNVGVVKWNFGIVGNEKKVKEWIKEHREKCDGKILVQNKKGEEYEEWRD